MVLSHKKLKHKLRDLKVTSLAASGDEELPEVQKIKEILTSNRSKKPKPKRRKKAPSHDGEEASKPDGNAETNATERKTKKRKLEVDKEKERAEIEERRRVRLEEKRKIRSSRVKKDKEEKRRIWEAKQEKERAETEEKKERAETEEKKERAESKATKKSGNGDGEKNLDQGSVDEVAIVNDIDNTKVAGNKVYVGGIPYYSSEEDIRSFFESCGTITEVDCLTFPETGKFRGIAFLTFKTDAAAKRALALDGADMGGFYLKIQAYKGKGNREQKPDFTPEILEGYNRIYAGNLAWEITEDDLRKLFVDCKISSIRFGMDKETGDFKGYAHIDFEDSASLNNALKLDQEVVCGRPVRIRCAVPKKDSGTSTSNQPVNNTEIDIAPESSKKKKRRTCYICGVPGHLSASCPQKGTSEVKK